MVFDSDLYTEAIVLCGDFPFAVANFLEIANPKFAKFSEIELILADSLAKVR